VTSELIPNLVRTLTECDSEATITCVRRAIESNVNPIKIMDAMTIAIRHVGDRFQIGELGLPDLIGAAEAMQSAVPILEQEVKRHGGNVVGSGTVVIGTVFGDIHSVGKAIVIALLRAAGFKVYDLGVDVKPKQFIEAIYTYKPDILAMSSLMTTTAPEQRNVIDALKEKGIREKIKVMVGGGAITQEFAESIGADGYAPTGADCVRIAKRLVSGRVAEGLDTQATRGAGPIDLDMCREQV